MMTTTFVERLIEEAYLNAAHSGVRFMVYKGWRGWRVAPTIRPSQYKPTDKAITHKN